jgi:hypothetical protein
MHHRTAMTLAMVACATQAAAQMPGAPILQNAWASPGIVVAFNFAGGSEGPVYSAAASWGCRLSATAAEWRNRAWIQRSFWVWF